MAYKYNVGDIVYSIDVNEDLSVKVFRGVIKSRWVNGSGNNTYDVEIVRQKNIKTLEEPKIEFDSNEQKARHKFQNGMGQIVKMSSIEDILIRKLYIRDIKKAVKKRKHQLERQKKIDQFVILLENQSIIRIMI